MNGIAYRPGYVALNRSGVRKLRGESLLKSHEDYRLSPRECRVDRIAGETGICKATSRLRVASFHALFG